jgi:hypothetical protein
MCGLGFSRTKILKERKEGTSKTSRLQLEKSDLGWKQGNKIPTLPSKNDIDFVALGEKVLSEV